MAHQTVRVTPRGYAVAAVLAVALLVCLGLLVKALGSDQASATGGRGAPPDHQAAIDPPATNPSTANPSTASAPHRHHQPSTKTPPAPRTPPPHQLKAAGLPGPFTAGSCLWLPPTHGDQHETVFLDAGHGGHDPGTSGVTSAGATIHEKTATLGVAKQASQALREAGYAVVMSRTRDSDVVKLPPSDFTGSLFTPKGDHLEILSGILCANASHASALVSIHFNSYPDAGVGGTETYYDDSRSFGKRNQRLAGLVQANLMSAFHNAGLAVPDRGVSNQDNQSGGALTIEGESYGHLLLLGPRKAGWNDHPSSMPGVLTEPLFLTRPTEADIAASANGQRVIGLAIASAVEAFLAHE